MPAESGSGAGGCGTVFKMTPTGTLTTLHRFDGADGGNPMAGLLHGTDGNFYGTTYVGGANINCVRGGSTGCGTVFKISPDGTFTTLYSFCSQPQCVDGSFPFTTLMQATDGNFYGTTEQGGTVNAGTVFKITPGGILTTLYSFCSLPNCADGVRPMLGSLVQATDGNFYGTTSGTDIGTAFQTTPGGILTTLYSFCSQPNCADGSYPFAGLLQATDGNFYGTTWNGGTGSGCRLPHGCGTVFRLATGLNPIPWQFVPVTPCRVVDTRNAPGDFGGPPLQGGTYRNFPLPQGACNIPATATAYSLNVTVVPSGRLGYLTIWPAGKNQPLVSTMNSPDGRTKANAAIVPAGASGGVNIYVSHTTNVVLDIEGYFTPVNSSTLAFYPLPPCRVLDTRNNNGALGGPYLSANHERDFPVLESTCIPSNAHAAAYSMNVTVVPIHGTLGYLTVWPTGEQQPYVSTLNNPTGTVVANAAIVPAGNGGEISAYPSNDTHLVVDINGYFAAPARADFRFIQRCHAVCSTRARTMVRPSWAP